MLKPLNGDEKDWKFQIVKDSLVLIGDLCVDYDGYHSQKELMSLIDELKQISRQTISILNSKHWIYRSLLDGAIFGYVSQLNQHLIQWHGLTQEEINQDNEQILNENHMIYTIPKYNFPYVETFRINQ